MELAIAYFRGKLDKYKNHKLIESIVNKVKESDYIVAPIADNRMFRIQNGNPRLFNCGDESETNIKR